MGMYYVFINNSEKYDLEDYFPDDLGWFCERAGAWGEDSELHQMEKILELNLTLLDHTRYSWEYEDSPGTIKSNTSEFRELIELIKTKIVSFPNYHQHITYQNHRSDICKDYLTSNDIINDLNSLLEVMDIYDQNGIKDFELSYG